MKKQIYTLFFMLAMIQTMAIVSADSFSNLPEKQPTKRFNLGLSELNLFDTASEQSKWAFMEKKFISDIYADKKMTWSHVTAAIPAAFAALAGYDYATDSSIIKSATKSNIVLLGGGALAAGIVSAQYLDYYLTQQAHRTAITDFFNNWNLYKLYVPAELLEYFTMIAETIEVQGLDTVLKKSQKIVKDVQDTIARHFESRYKKLLEFEAANNLSDTKTVSEIFKNFVGGAKDLAA